MEIESRAHSDHDDPRQAVAVLKNPLFLARLAKPHEDKIGAGIANGIDPGVIVGTARRVTAG